MVTKAVIELNEKSLILEEMVQLDQKRVEAAAARVATEATTLAAESQSFISHFQYWP